MRITVPIAMSLALIIAGFGQPAVAQDTGAYVSKDLGCGGFIPTRSGGVGELIYTNEGAIVVRGNGTTSLSCHFDIPPEIAQRVTTRAAKFLCNTYLGQTYDSRMQASAGGNATLTCRIRRTSDVMRSLR